MATDDDDEVELDGLLKQVLIAHKDSEVTGMLVLVFEGDQAHVYNSNIRQDIVDMVADAFAVKSNG